MAFHLKQFLRRTPATVVRAYARVLWPLAMASIHPFRYRAAVGALRQL
jgi:hypothetical protein